MELAEIITLITLIAGLVGAIAALVPTLINLFKALSEIVKNKNWQALKDIAKAAMAEVEEHYRTHPEMTGDDKLNMAIEIVVAGAKEINVEITEETIKNLVNYINETIKWANSMKK